MKQNEREKTREFLVDWCKCYVYCFTNESTDKWKKKFMEDRLNRFLEDNSLLGINIHVSLIVSLYAVISNLILLPFEIKISNLAEEI